MESPEKSKAFADERLELMIAAILRTGVLAAALVVGVSGVIYLAKHHADPPRYRTFRMESAALTSIGGILKSAARLQADAMIQLGLLLLIATPIVRVGLAVVGFYREGDRLYVGVSLVVFAVLLFSILHST
jgi:uncharacterized membrane protein